MSAETHRKIERLVAKLARRIRVQRATEGFITGATLTAMLAMLALVLFKTGWIDDQALFATVGASLLAPLTLAFVGWLRPLDRIALAQRLDRSHDLHDRLSTALALGERGAETTFEEAQITEAAEHVGRVDPALAAPLRRPTDLIPLAALAACLAVIAILRPPSHVQVIPQPPEIQHEQVLDTATIAMERDRLEAIRRELQGVDDPEAVALLDEIEQLLNEVEEQEISEREFLDRLNELEKKLEENEEAMDPEEAERLAEKLKEAAEELEKEMKKELEKEPAAQELVDAMKKKDLARASKAMQKMAEMLANKDLDEKKLERLAKIMEKLSKNIDFDDPALQKLMEKNKDLIEKLSKKFDKLGEKDKNRLKRAQEELKRQQEQQKKNEERESTRQLKKLRRLSKKSSEDAKKSLERGDKKNDKEMADKEKYQQQSGRAAKEASEEMEQGGKQQQKQQARDAARKQIEEMREAMKRSRRAGQKGEKQDGRQGEQMKEFLERAKGQQKTNMKAKVEQKMPTGQEGGAGEREHDLQGGKGKAEKDTGGSDDAPSEQSDFAGKGKGSRELGEETSLDSKRVDEKVDVDAAGEGPSRSEIIKSASEEGFATTEYKDVYVDYSSVVEEVMDKEKIPAGYRFYVKRYFQLIKPQE